MDASAPRRAKAAYSRRASAESADIGTIPAVANPGRRADCERNLLLFLKTYFPQTTGKKPLSEDHVRVVGRFQTCVFHGGHFLNVMPRGFAKTTISENAAMWALLYGHRKFIPIFAAGKAEAENIIESIKTELSENDLLFADFPEVCHPIRALENKSARCATQTYSADATCEPCGGRGSIESSLKIDGQPASVQCEACKGAGKARVTQRTYIGWRAGEVILPTIAGSAASGGILSAKGIEGASRGLKHKLPDGTQQRPNFVIIDDPQTDESAATPAQVEKRLSILRKTILKLGGHGERIGVVMNATIIRRGDLIEQLMNRRRFPAWQSERIKMVREWSKGHETFWLDEYARARNDYNDQLPDDQRRAHREATELYARNRERADAGCVVSWEQCYDPDAELSAIQHAYNLLIDDGPEVFASECQNEPLEEKIDDDGLRITTGEVMDKLNRLPRGKIPLAANRLVAFIDPKKDILFWTVLAFADGYNGWVVDYGTYPDQKKAYFSARSPLHRLPGKGSWEAALYAGLETLVGTLAGRTWEREDGTAAKIELCPIDAHWGEATETVRLFCKQSPHAALVMPSFGVGTRKFAFNSQARKPGERRGTNWAIPPGGGRVVVRHVLFDANWWKSFVASRWKTPFGATGCLSVFGDKPDIHRMFADHQASEIPRVVETGGRKFIEFDEQPGVDNDLFDCVVGCHVAASIQGVNLIQQAEKPRAKVRLSELQKQKQHAATPQR